MSLTNTQMQGKICLVTGANSGIGKATTLALAEMGATIVMVCRNRAKGEAAQQEIKAKSGNDAVDLLIADLSSQASISQLADTFKQRYQHLHVLINNAGVFMLQRRETVDGLEMSFAVNHLAPFLLTNLLLDVLKASAPARIINVSSDAHFGGAINFDDLQSSKNYGIGGRVYAQSKLADVLFTYELARRLQGTGVTANCLHPGFVKTNIAQADVSPPLRVVAQLIFIVSITPEEGAKTSVYLASAPEVEGITGKYFAKSIPVRSKEISYDESLQKRMWDVSTALVKLPAYN